MGEAGEKADVLSREFGPQTVVLELKENIAVQRRATTVAQALARAEDLFAKQMFAVAAVELHEALQKCRGDKKLEAALEFALAQKTAQEKAAAVRRTLSDCKMLVAAGKEADALATAKRAVEDFGREPALLDFIRQLGLEVEQRNQQLRQQQELRNLADSTLHTALELEGRQAYRPALETVQIALAKVQDDRLDEVCQRLQGKLRQQDEEARIRRQEDERRRTEQQEANNQRKIRHTATARAISEANGLVRQRNFQQACNVLEHCGEIYPDSPELKEAYQEVRREWEEFERTKQERIAAERLENQRKVRAAAIAKGLSAANAMLQGQEFQEACASLQQLTVTFPDAGTHPMRNVLTQAVGSREVLDVHIWEDSFSSGDAILLCSDGMYGVVGPLALETALASTRDPPQILEDLISQSLAGGATDNVSAILIYG